MSNEKEKFNWSMLMNSILASLVCWIIVNNFVIPIGIIKFGLLELLLTSMHLMFEKVHVKLSEKLSK